MADLQDLINGEKDWLVGIPPFAQRRIQEIQKANPDYEDVARIWLSTIGSSSVVPMGAGGGQEFFQVFKAEFYEFICGGKKYQAERDKLQKLAKPTEMLIVSSIAAALSPFTGAAAALLGPAVAALLSATAKVGHASWCKANKPQG